MKYVIRRQDSVSENDLTLKNDYKKYQQRTKIDQIFIRRNIRKVAMRERRAIINADLRQKRYKRPKKKSRGRKEQIYQKIKYLIESKGEKMV